MIETQPQNCPWGCHPEVSLESVPSHDQLPDKGRYVVRCRHARIVGPIRLCPVPEEAIKRWNDREGHKVRDNKDVIEQISPWLTHDIGCKANDLDYLDKSPCTCGLRNYYNPKGQAHDF